MPFCTISHSIYYGPNVFDTMGSLENIWIIFKISSLLISIDRIHEKNYKIIANPKLSEEKRYDLQGNYLADKPGTTVLKFQITLYLLLYSYSNF